MKKKVNLKDDTEIIIREMRKDDLDRSFKFFKDLPEEDRKYLRVDVTKREVVEQRIKRQLADKVVRLVAVSGDEIVGDGAIELEGLGWTKHVGEMRLIISRPYQNRGLGLLMARELYIIATQRKLEKIVVQMMRPQDNAQKIFRKLGFHEELIIPEAVKDLTGHSQDLVHMSCNLEELKEQLEHLFLDSDWRAAHR